MTAASLFAEGMNTGSLTDPSKTPVFNTCTDIAQIVKNKPVLLPAYSQLLEESGSPAHAVKGPVEIDVQTGTIAYRVYSSLNGDTVERPTFVNRACTEVDPATIKQGVDAETQAIRQEIQQMFDSADALYERAQQESEGKSDGATKSDVLGQALAGNVEDAQKAEEKVQKYTGGGGAAGSSGISPQLGFMARINSVNNEMQTLIFLGAIVLTLIGLGAGYVSKKIQKRADHEDYIARFGLGVVMWFLLFAPANTYKYGDGEISQTRMQAIWGWVLNQGTGAANKLAGAAHHEQMRYTIQKSGGKNIEQQISSAVQEKLALENKQGAYEAILQQCIQSYRVNDLMMAIGDAKGGGKRYFPTDESMVKMGDEDVYSRYLLPAVSQDGVYMSLTTCGKAEEQYRSLVKRSADLQYKIDAAKDIRFQEKYTSSAKQIVQDTTSAGWIGVAMLPVHHFIANGVGQQIEKKMHPTKYKEEEQAPDCEGEWTLSNFPEKIGCKVEQLENFLDPFGVKKAIETLSFDEFVESVSQRAPLLMIPGVTNLGEYIYKMFDSSNIPFIGTFGAILGFFISTEVSIIILQNLPFIVLIPAISIVIALYHAEVFFYSVTIPYVAAYAFSRDQWGHLVKHAVRGIMIALKPAMIVISVYASVYVSDVITGMSSNMIQKQSAILMSRAHTEYQTVDFLDSVKNSLGKLKPIAVETSYVDGINISGGGIFENAINYLTGEVTVFLIQGFLYLIMAVIQVYIVIKIIVSGPVMMMEMFGVRETDMASQMTESVSASAKRYEGGI